MDDHDRQRLEGLRQLVHLGIGRGSEFVEKHHRHAAGRVFSTIRAFEPLEPSVAVVQTVHDVVLTVSYVGVRVVNRGTERAAGWLFQLGRR